LTEALPLIPTRRRGAPRGHRYTFLICVGVTLLAGTGSLGKGRAVLPNAGRRCSSTPARRPWLIRAPDSRGPVDGRAMIELTVARTTGSFQSDWAMAKRMRTSASATHRFRPIPRATRSGQWSSLRSRPLGRSRSWATPRSRNPAECGTPGTLSWQPDRTGHRAGPDGGEVDDGPIDGIVRVVLEIGWQKDNARQMGQPVVMLGFKG